MMPDYEPHGPDCSYCYPHRAKTWGQWWYLMHINYGSRAPWHWWRAVQSLWLRVRGA